MATWMNRPDLLQYASLEVLHTDYIAMDMSQAHRGSVSFIVGYYRENQRFRCLRI